MVLSVAGLAGATYLAITHKTMPLPYEQVIFHAINGLPDAFRPFVLWLTYFGSVWVFLAVGLLATITKRYRLAWWLSVSVAITYGAVYLIKNIVERSRPEGLLEQVAVRAHETSFGFPSGHTAVGTVIALTLFFYLPKGIRWAIVPLWIIGVGMSRVYLGVHSPLDVLGGICIGVAVFAFLRVLPNRVRCWIKLSDDTKHADSSEKTVV